VRHASGCGSVLRRWPATHDELCAPPAPRSSWARMRPWQHVNSEPGTLLVSIVPQNVLHYLRRDFFTLRADSSWRRAGHRKACPDPSGSISVESVNNHAENAGQA
jgi:hypothetical protein